MAATGSSFSYFSADTIIAIATSVASDAGVGIIRVSGGNAGKLALALCEGFKAEPARFLHRIEVKSPRTGEVLDDGLGVYFPEGQSFTGDEVVELQLHGGRFVLQTILQEALSTGLCRLALPGEFSFRAVRNGKLSLREASALQQTIAAKSDFELRVARKNLSKDRDREIQEVGRLLRDLVAKVELSIDFADQDVEILSKEELQDALSKLAASVAGLLRKLMAAKKMAQGLQVVLFGSPNAGKSTLFNAMLSEDRAIVSPVAGTTRDVITEELLIGPYRLRLADTAGVRGSIDAIESEGIAKAKDLAESADVVLYIADSTLGWAGVEEAMAGAGALRGAPIEIAVLTKADLIAEAEMRALREELARRRGTLAAVPVSGKTGAGVLDLANEIREKLDSSCKEAREAFLPTEFQLSMLMECGKQVERTLHLVEKRGLNDPELASAGLRSAAQALSQMIGETTPDSVLTQIFSEFCIGK